MVDASWLGVTPIIWIAGSLALYMAWAIGANDVANAMGTSVGSGALSIRNAVIIAGLLEFCRAFFVGAHVTDTVRKGILDTAAFSENPDLLKFGMLGALAAAATLLVGGVLGYGIFQLIQVLILNREDPLKQAKRYAPAFFFVVFFTIGLVTLFKGLKNLNLDYDLPEALLRAAVVGGVGAVFGVLMTRRMKTAAASDHGRFSRPSEYSWCWSL